MSLRSTRALCLVAAALLSLAPRGAMAATSLASPAVRAAIDAVVAKARAVYGGRSPVPSVLVGVWNPTGSYVHAYGFADLAKHRPLTTADHFRIGSNTKTFVISVLLQLVDEGYLRLDDPLSKFSLGVRIPNGRHITVREVCQMRSGLFEAYNTPQVNALDREGKLTPDAVFHARELVRWAVHQKPLFAPGTSYNYSNTNYLILGLLIESITHDTVAHEIGKRLIGRFGLRQTSYPATQAMPDPWAHGYGLDKNKNWEDVSGTIPVSLMGAAGEMISDMHDMVRWVRLIVTGKTSAPATQRERLACVYTGDGNLYFGLGIGCSAGYYGYTGGLPGYNTANYYMPSTDTTILAWVPVQNDKPFPGAANAIFSNIARIVTPAHVPFVKTRPSTGRSGL
jgi:D-alanyl-D-alanine carboxypeptidase